MVTSAHGRIVFMESSASNSIPICYSLFGAINPGASASTGSFTFYKIAAFRTVSDALSGTGGTYNMATATVTINIGACTYNFKLDHIGTGASSPSTTPTPKITPTPSSGSRVTSPGALLSEALAALLLLAAPVRR
jgi:hypothetical protein